MTGQVKFFNQEKFWGFIASDDGVDVFAHGRDCVDEVKKGDRVEFEVETRTKGPGAVSVRRIETEVAEMSKG